ncbi:NERD domain-containing protein [Clostridium vincentii]|uniref:ATP-dependent DNA helicase RecQ n=1 Tax=Clostridium vincentii TaxID=52704 RepID=A0A2T0B7F7_9CLOT|nr:NERD domain-containing protein [Clostridium vincentii]PRR79829.1 ATP-dependent DNA helicase RecQ [Clostridium vincentii]
MSILEAIFGQKKTIDKPIFIKDFCNDNTQLKDLQDLFDKLNDGEKKDVIEKDIMLQRYGISGESNVHYELKTSFMPMLCLHDVRIEHEDYVAQLDFVVITNKFLAVLETKKLNGNITVNRDGDFIRTIRTRRGREFKEGIYSPITQNARHSKIVKELLSQKLNINKIPLKSLVVMANPKSIINKDKCPSDIKASLYKCDQVIKQLEKLQGDKKNEYNINEKRMYAIADLLLKMNTPIHFNNHAKYNLVERDFCKYGDVVKTIAEVISEIVVKPEINKDEAIEEKVETVIKESSKKDINLLTKELKKFRLEASKEENTPAYCVFNNAQMEDLIEKYPVTLEKLLEVKGFGEKKIEKYGEGILRIMNN